MRPLARAPSAANWTHFRERGASQVRLFPPFDMPVAYGTGHSSRWKFRAALNTPLVKKSSIICDMDVFFGVHSHRRTRGRGPFFLTTFSVDVGSAAWRKTFALEQTYELQRKAAVDACITLHDTSDGIAKFKAAKAMRVRRNFWLHTGTRTWECTLRTSCTSS